MSVISLDEWRQKRDDASTSPSPSTQTSASEEPGQTPTDVEIAMLRNVLCVLQRARVKPFTTKSDFARMAANEVALCASDGLITTRLDDNIVSNVWVVTQDGMVALEELTDAFN